MKKKELDSWFNSLDSYELGFMFVREVKAMWKNLSLEEKIELYEQYK